MIGLRIRDQNGLVVVDSSIRQSKYIRTFEITTSPGGISIPELQGAGQPWWVMTRKSGSIGPFAQHGLTVTFNPANNTLNWAWPELAAINNAEMNATYLPYLLTIGAF